MRIGVDIGGTFTDLVLTADEDGRSWTKKVRTTPDDPSIGVMEGIEFLLGDAQVEASQVQFFGHGTTVATNAFLQRKGARTGLITTRGFRDILEFRRLARDGPIDAYDLFFDFPEPFVPRAARAEVDERTEFDGTVSLPLDPMSVDQASAQLEKLGVESVAISLIHGYANPEHERLVRERLRRVLPDVYVSVSHEVNPEILEYERTSTTVINAYLGPPVRSYVERLHAAAVDRGLPALHLLQSNGGLAGVEAAAELPVSLLESGPAGGLSACIRIAAAIGEPNFVMLDIGGTSTDIAVVAEGAPRLLTHTQIDGHAIRIPTVDIRSIGAGGGSLLTTTPSGGLAVGPDSAGSVPGPVCYGLGGTVPAMTDATVALGLLGESSLLGGAMQISRDAALTALAAPAARMQMEPLALAAGAFRIMNASIAAAVRVALVERGLDPREFTLLALGGAGPVHASSVAAEIGIPRVVVPAFPGITSAIGAATTDLIHHYATAVMAATADIIPERLEGRFCAMEERGRSALNREGIKDAAVTLVRQVDMRYVGQYHEAPIPFAGAATPESIERATAQFHARHRALFGFNQPNDPVMITNARVQARGLVSVSPLLAPDDPAAGSDPAATRRVSFGGTSETWSVYQRSRLSADFDRAGPCIIEQLDSTTVVLPGQRVRRSDSECLYIDLEVRP